MLHSTSRSRNVTTPLSLLVLDREATRRVDVLAVERYGMSSLVLMENAGRGVADTLERLGVPGKIVICCGPGNNGGDGFVTARHLDLRGHDVETLLFADPEKLRGDAAANNDILRRSGVFVESFPPEVDRRQLERKLQDAAWIIDALLGTGSKGDPRPPLDAVIHVMNAAGAPKLAVDIPSGLDCDSGATAAATVRASHTCTFVALKPAFLQETTKQFTGEISVLDIGAPRQLIEEIAAEAARSK